VSRVVQAQQSPHVIGGSEVARAISELVKHIYKSRN
jgi:hypothetical protein